MAAIKCPYCQSDSALQIHAPHIPHAVLHTAGHHSKELARLASSNPITAMVGVGLAGAAWLIKSLAEGKYKCKQCHRKFKA